MHFWLCLKNQRLRLTEGRVPRGVTADLPYMTSQREFPFLGRAAPGCPLLLLGCRGSAGIRRSRQRAPELTRGPSPQHGVNKLVLKVTSSGSGSGGRRKLQSFFRAVNAREERTESRLSSTSLASEASRKAFPCQIKSLLSA